MNWFPLNPFLSYSFCSSNLIDLTYQLICCTPATCGVSNAHPLVSPAIPVIIHLCHSSIALPMLGVPKLSVGVSLPHFAASSSNGGQVGFFFIGTRVDTQRKKQWGYTCADAQKKLHRKLYFFPRCHASHSRDTCQHPRDSPPPPPVWAVHINGCQLHCS